MEPSTSTARLPEDDQFMLTFFDQPDLQVQAIQVDEEAEYRSYALSLYERVKSIKTGTNGAAIQETLTANELAGRLQYISIPLREPIMDFDFRQNEVKDLETVEVEDMNIVVPIPKAEHARKWLEQMEEYEKALDAHASELEHAFPTIATDFNRATRLPERHPASMRLSRDVLQTRNMLLTLLIKEIILKRNLKLYGDQCAKLLVQPDPSTDGIWINRGKEDPRSLMLPIVVVPVQRKLKFDARTTLLLIQMQFSAKPDVRATAKLDLNARLEQGRMNDVIASPDAILAIAIAEARLTPLEILSVMFPKPQNAQQHQCLSCNTTVHVSTTTFYHTKCITVEWLIKYQPFKYNEREGAIVPIKRAYVSPTHRMRMCQLLELHAQLNGDIIVKNGSETTIWKRNDDGTLRKVNLQSIREEDQVGSYAWRRKHGFTTAHGAVK